MLVVNWWRYGSVTNFGYALGTATNQSYPIVRGVVNQWFSSGKSLFLFAPIAARRVVRPRSRRPEDADGDRAPREPRGGQHAVLRPGAVLVGRLGLGPALPPDRGSVPCRDGRTAHGSTRVAARGRGGQCARLLLRRVAGRARALHARVLLRRQADACRARSDLRFGITAITRSCGTRSTGSRSCTSCACCLTRSAIRSVT